MGEKGDATVVRGDPEFRPEKKKKKKVPPRKKTKSLHPDIPKILTPQGVAFLVGLKDGLKD